MNIQLKSASQNREFTYGNYPDLSGVKRILVIKMRHHGDVLLTSPLLHTLKKALPNAQLDMYIYKDTLPMLEGNSHITDFHLYDRGWKSLSFFQRLRKEIALLRKIRRSRYDLVINLTEGDRGAIAARISKAVLRVGYEHPKKAKNRSYTHHVKVCQTPRHTVEQHLDVARCLGIFSLEKELEFSLPEASIEKMNALLKAEGIEQFVVIHPVSRWLFKCPPPYKIAQWIQQLDAIGKKVVITAGPDKKEMQMVEQILSLVPNVKAYNLAGKITLKELGALIKLSDCLLCVDSVPLHMASALKTPVAVVFGPSVEKIWGPWMHPQSRVITYEIACRPCGMDGCGGSKRSECLAMIESNAVLNAVNSIYGNK